jgi:hypothetical protein
MATLATPGDIRDAAPEFSSLTDPQIQRYIDMADEEINPDAWGSRAKRAEILLTCHKMVVLGARDQAGQGAGGAASGPVQSVKVGEVSVSYGATSSLAVQLHGLDASLASNRYGVEYARLQKLAAYGGAVLNGE